MSQSAHNQTGRRYSQTNPPDYETRVRRKRRSKYDVSRIFERSQSRTYCDFQPGKNRFYQSPEMETLKSDPSLNLRRQKDRTVFTDHQTLILESAFQKNKHPDAQRRELVAQLCDLSAETVRIWYQNRRAKEKRVEEDELALLAKRVVNNSNDNSSTNKKPAYHCLASINNKINRIFDCPDESKDEKDEGIIQKIIIEEMNGSKQMEMAQLPSSDNDRWNRYRIPVSNYVNDDNDDDEDEKNLVKSFLRNDPYLVAGPQSYSRDHDTCARKPKRRRRIHSKKVAPSEQHKQNVQYGGWDEMNDISQRLVNQAGHTNRYDQCYSAPLRYAPGSQSTTEDHLKLPAKEYYGENHDKSEPSLSSPTSFRLPSENPGQMFNAQQFYFFQLMVQKQMLESYRNFLAAQCPMNQAEFSQGAEMTQQSTMNMLNRHEHKHAGNSQPHSSPSWTEFLNADSIQLPHLVDAFQHKFSAKCDNTPVFDNDASSAGSSRQSGTDREGFSKHSAINKGREYEMVKTVYEEKVLFSK